MSITGAPRPCKEALEHNDISLFVDIKNSKSSLDSSLLSNQVIPTPCVDEPASVSFIMSSPESHFELKCATPALQRHYEQLQNRTAEKLWDIHKNAVGFNAASSLPTRLMTDPRPWP